MTVISIRFKTALLLQTRACLAASLRLEKLNCSIEYVALIIILVRSRFTTYPSNNKIKAFACFARSDLLSPYSC
jgi:hypothetical protein